MSAARFQTNGFLQGGGELGRLIGDYDWSRTPLGPLDSWPQSLKTVTGMLLRSPVPIVLLWGELGIMIYNDAYSGFAGGRHPQLLGSEVRKGWPEVADFNDNVMQVGLAGRTLAYKDQELTLHRHGRPERVWMNLDYSPVLDEAGQPAGVIAIVVETTKRIMAERQLLDERDRVRDSEERFRALVNATSDVVYRMSADWRMIQQLDGKGIITDAEGKFDWITEYIQPEDQDLVQRTIAYAIEAKGIFELEHRVMRVDGSTGWVLSRAVPLLDDQGDITEWFGAASDITARKEAEQSMRDSARRLVFLDALGRETTNSTDADVVLATTTRMLGQYLHVGICAYADMDADQDGFTIRGDWSAPDLPSIVGRYKLRAFGQRAVSELRAGLPLILHDSANELPTHEAETFRGIGAAATICMPLVKDGRLTALMAIHDHVPRRWTASELALLTEVAERSWAHIERVRSEAAVRLGEQRFREELEAKVAERTAALFKVEHALQQAQKMEAIGNLTGGIAHDFNNLLMAVSGSLELLRKRMPHEPPLLRLLDNAMAGARRGNSLTSRMLAFARRQDLKVERIDVESLVAGMTELLQRALGPTITVETQFAAHLPGVETDTNQLESALLNLALNARDAMHGEGRIVITARDARRDIQHGLHAGHYVCLSVTDTGEGMDEATLKRATEPFFTTKGVGKGTGLGLSMIHGLAEQSGGKLVLKSTPGSGTTAEIWLPALDGPALSPGAEMPTVILVPEPQAAAPLVILAVDDDTLVLMNTAEMLEDLGHRVFQAPSAKEALALLEHTRIDLVITDHAMPHMTGAQLAAELRGRLPDLPIILATGFAELPATVQTDLPRLSKPFSQAELAEAVAKVATA